MVFWSFYLLEKQGMEEKIKMHSEKAEEERGEGR